MKMNWFRVYNDARIDAKLRTLSDAQFRVWFNLLCLSSEQIERGVIADYDLDLLSIEVAGGDDDLLRGTIKQLVRLRIMCDDGSDLTFIHFLERQYDKPSDYPEARRARVTKHRDISNKEGVTRSNAMKRDETHIQEEIREEKNREEEIREEKREGGAPQAATPRPPPLSTTKGKRDRTRETSIPDNFAPTVKMLSDAKKKYPNMDVLAASEAWLNSMRANRSRYRHTDWNLAWWSGMDKAEQWGNHRLKGSNGNRAPNTNAGSIDASKYTGEGKYAHLFQQPSKPK